jgi:hypothetical protein
MISAMKTISSFIIDANILIVEIIAKRVEIRMDMKEIFIILIEPISVFLNLGTIINPIPIIKSVRPLSI